MTAIFTHKKTKRRIKQATVCFILLIVCCNTIFAQDTAFISTQQNNPVKNVSEGHNPKKSLILSAVLPGAGQVYNRQAWKVPIIYAGIGGMAYVCYQNYQQMKTFKDEYLYRVQNGTTNLEEYASYPDQNIYNMYESYNKNFQLFVIISVGLYAVNLLDAYVFGHLYDFQINDDLSLNILPSVAPLANNDLGAIASFKLTWRF